MKNFNEGMDAVLNSGLDGLPVANTLYIWLCSNAESDVTPASVLANLTKVGTTVVATGVLTSSLRIIDLGAADFSAETSGTVKSIVISTNNPGTAGAKAFAIQDLNSGAAIDLSTAGGLIVDDISIEVAYFVSGSVG